MPQRVMLWGIDWPFTVGWLKSWQQGFLVHGVPRASDCVEARHTLFAGPREARCRRAEFRT